ncbi:hypothetical protein BH10ACT3_BH10ACT3_04650 [soil metagenome]
MKDVVVILMTLGFFALCVGYVALCDRIVGPDDVDADRTPDSGVASVDVDSGAVEADPVLAASGGASTPTGQAGVTR